MQIINTLVEARGLSFKRFLNKVYERTDNIDTTML